MPAHQILLFEPDKDLRELLVQVLDEEGYATLASTTVLELLSLAEHHAVSVVLAEVRELEASVLASTIERLQRAVRPTPIGLLTALRPSNTHLAAMGFDFVLRKPFSLEELLTTIGFHTRAKPKPEEEARVGQYFEALTRRDWQGLAGLCSERVEYNLPGQNEKFSGQVTGPEALARHAKLAFDDFPAATFAVKEIVALPHAVIARYTARWSPEGAMDGSVLFRFEGGLISQIGVRLELQKMLALVSGAHP